MVSILAGDAGHDQNVVRLMSRVHQSGRVRGIQRRRHLRENGHRFGGTEAALAPKPASQSPPPTRHIAMNSRPSACPAS